MQIGLMASPTTIRTELYEKPLRDLGIAVQTPNHEQLMEIEQAIRSVIAGTDTRSAKLALRSIQADMLANGAEAILLGCTELSVLFPDKEKALIDPLHIITNVVVEPRL